MKREILFILIFVISSSFVLSSGGCTVSTISDCNSYISVLGISGINNAHAALVGNNPYNYVICCDIKEGEFEIDLADSEEAKIELSSQSNAHVGIYSGGNYFMGFGEDSGCDVVNRNDCNIGDDEFCVFSLFDDKNSHIASCNNLLYNKVLCCEGTASGPGEEGSCGDGNLDDGEQCDWNVPDEDIEDWCEDYGNLDNFDECSSSCMCDFDSEIPEEEGWTVNYIQSECVACEGIMELFGDSVNCDLFGGYYTSTGYSYDSLECSLTNCMNDLCDDEFCTEYPSLSACYVDVEEDVPFFDWFSIVMVFGILTSYYIFKKRKSL
jgi:hypothetical protein